jgi:hypothetical protein
MRAEPHNLTAVRILVPFSFHLLFLSRSNPLYINLKSTQPHNQIMEIILPPE